MISRFIEATNIQHGGLNWGKFLLAKFEESDWQYQAVEAPGHALLAALPGREPWRPEHIIVFDLQTGEGLRVNPRGEPGVDLVKHRVWVCPLFEPFLYWMFDYLAGLPTAWRGDIMRLPPVAYFKADSALAGYRRGGP